MGKGKMDKAKEWAEKPAYLTSDAAKFSLGIHRGPMPSKEQPVDGGELEHADTMDTITMENIKRTPTQNLRRHWARFWCCYVFWNIIFLAIFLPIFFKIVIPAVAQNVVNRSTLLLTHASILEPRPESVRLSVGSALKLPLALPAKTDPLALSLFNRDQPMNNTFGKIYLPATTILGNTTLSTENQFTPLEPEQWYNYVWKVVHLRHPPLSVKSKTTAYLGKLVSHITLDKDIPQTTLGNFTGWSITDSQLLLNPRPDGTNLIANATLPNPSVLTLEIGNTTLDLYSGNLLLGNGTLPNLLLRPGNHSTPVEGILDLDILISNLKTILKDQASALKQGNLELTAIGSSVVFDGVEVPYYTKVMRSLTLTATVPIGELLTNTIKGLGDGQNPFKNLTVSEPEGADDSGGGGLLSSLSSGGGSKRKRELLEARDLLAPYLPDDLR